MLTSLLSGSASGNPWTRLWDRIMRRRQQARRRPARQQLSTTRIELLETRVLLTDFGDAPSPFPVTTAENGARHAEVGPTLGSSRDGEADGAHSTNATGDDTTGSDDEDGVTFPATVRIGDLGVQITVNVQGITTTGKLDAWIDFNGDGVWGGPGEQVANNKAMVNGNNTLTFDVPVGAKAGTTYARFRLSTAGNLGTRGAAADGEVEDYSVTINNPNPSTATFGARNIVTSSTNGTQAAFAADIDGDGDMDLLSASSYDDKIAWYENDGTPKNGGWSAHTISTAVNAAEAVFAIDMDGDGDLDVVAASRYDDKVAWYENDGTPAVGAWTERSISTAVNGVNAVYPTDLDGDGDIDVVASASYDNKIVWLENNGSQSFTLRSLTGTASAAISVFAADMDRDGDMDIVSASVTDDKVAWYENDGSQTFTQRTITTTTDQPNSVFVADIDKDGDMDVAVASFQDNKISWFENDGTPADGGWVAHVVTTSAGGTVYVVAADMDGDGDIDLLSANVATVTIYKNDGAQAFSATDISTANQTAQAIIAADIDQDGDLDALVGSYADDTVSWFENLNDTTAPSTTSFARQTPAGSATNADSLTFRVTFSEAVTGVAAADFSASGTTATLSVSAVSTSVYDVTLTGGDLATLNGTVGLNFAASPTITDLYLNALPATEPSIDQTYAVDNTAPGTTSFVRQNPASSATIADTLVYRVTFSEAVTGVDAADFSASGTTATIAVATVNSSTYDITLSGGNLATLNGTVNLNLSVAGSITDAAGNALPKTEPAIDETYTVDNAAPSTTSFVLQTPNTSTTNADSLTFRVTFNEDVTGVAAADFVATGTTATLSVNAVSASVYDVTLTGGNLTSLNGAVGQNFNSPTITDLAGNSLPNTEPTTDQTFTVDNTAPTTTSFIRQVPSGSATNANSLTFRVTFGEAVTGVDAADFVATGTTATCSIAVVSSSVYDVTLTGGDLASLNATVGLNFAASPTIADLAGNALPSTEPATDQTYVVDNTAPSTTSFVRQTPSGSPTNADTLVFRVTFSESVTGVSAASFVASGTTAPLSVASVSASVYDVTLTGGNLASLNGAVGLDFNSPSISDLAGNALPATEPTTDQTFVVDNTAPGTTSFVRQTPGGSPTNADTLVFRVTFSEDVTGVAAADFAASGTTATLSVASVSASVYDVTLTGGNLASLNGTVGLNFAASPTVNDLAGNALPNTEPATDQTFVVDNAAPSTTSFVRQTPGSTPTNADSLVFRVTFSEDVTGVAAADFAASGTTATISVAAVSASVYDVTLSGGDLANLNGTVGLNFAVSPTINDLAGNALPSTEPVTDQTFAIDNTAPAIASFVRNTPGSSPTNADTLVFRVTFSEAVTGVDVADFLAGGTTATLTVAAVSSSVYDVTLTGGNLASLNGTVGLNVAASPTVNDLAGNALPNTEPATDDTYVVDNAAPSATSFVLQTPSTSPTNADTLVFRVTFSEGVTGVAAADFTASGTTAGLSVASVSASVYDVTLSGGNLASLSGKVGLNFTGSPTINDLAGNALPGTEPVTDDTFVVDNTAPTLVITPNGTTTNANLITFTFQFSESVSGFDASDISVTNGTKGLFSAVDGDTYALVVTPIADGPVSVSVGTGVAVDAATNGNVAASASITSDRTASTLNITPNGILTNAGSITFTLQFTGAVIGFDTSDVNVTNGTKGTFTAVDGDTYTLVVTPVADGVVTVDVNADVATDGAGNGNTASTASITSDRTAPTLNITPDGTLTNAAATTFTFQFNEVVTGFDATDISVTNGTKGTFTAIDGDTYTLVVTPVADGTIAVSVNANAASDAATNGNTAASATITSDRTAPTLNITPDGTLTNAAATTFTFQFNEVVTGFDATDISVTNGTKGTFTAIDGDTYTLVVTPVADGTISVSVNANAASDAATNGNTAASATITSDRTAPTLNITPDGTLTNAAATTFTFQFSSPVTGFNATDINVSNGTKGSFVAVDGDTYKLVVTPVAVGTVSVSVNANAASDAATNGNTAASATITSDRTAPSLTITPDGILTNSASTIFTFQFTEPVTGFGAGDVNVTNGSKGTFIAIDGDTYTLVVTPSANGAVVVQVNANSASDSASNGNTAASASITSDRTAPALSITPDGTLTNAAATSFTFQFTSVVTGFDVSDISVTNGEKGTFTAVDGDTYALVVTPVSDGLVTVSVAGNVSTDIAGNGNTASSAAITSDRTPPALTITPNGTLTNAASTTFTFQFTDPVNGFTAADISLTNGSKGTFTAIGPSTYTLVVTPIADGNVVVNVNANVAIDDANNGNLPATASIASDRTAPTLTITPDGTLTNAASTTFTIQFNGPVTGFDASDIALTNGTPGTFTVVDAATYTLAVTPVSDGVVSVSVNADAATDAAANGNPAASASIVSDRSGPVFTSLASHSLPENSSDALTIAATDAHGPVTYAILVGLDAARFAIDQDSGVLQFLAPPDFEAPADGGTDNTYDLDVSATDSLGQQTIQHITIAVTALNDNSPVIGSPATFQVNENVQAVGSVLATDLDQPSQSISYSITGGSDANRFSISETGVLTFNTAPDFEVPTDVGGDHVYELQVTADDGAGRTTVQNVSVTVLAVNDNVPVFSSPSTFQVDENTGAVTTVAAVDADAPAQTVTYSISGGADASRFALSSDGVLTFISPPDFEIPDDADGNRVYEIEVTANDGSGGTTSQSVTISVVALNDNAPAFTTAVEFSLLENELSVGTVVATDADSPAQVVTYQITGGADASLFGMSSAGVLEFVSAPDFEIPGDADENNVYELQVTANDGNGLTTTQTIAVTVVDFSEAPQLTLGGADVTWIKKHPPVNILPDVVVLGNGSLTGGELTINMNAVGSKKKSKDLLTSPSFSAWGTSSGLIYNIGHLSLQIHLGANVTASAVESFLRGITFATKGKGLKSPTRTITVSLSNAAEQSSTISQVVHVRKK